MSKKIKKNWAWGAAAVMLLPTLLILGSTNASASTLPFDAWFDNAPAEGYIGNNNVMVIKYYLDYTGRYEDALTIEITLSDPNGQIVKSLSSKPTSTPVTFTYNLGSNPVRGEWTIKSMVLLNGNHPPLLDPWIKYNYAQVGYVLSPDYQTSGFSSHSQDIRLLGSVNWNTVPSVVTHTQAHMALNVDAYAGALGGCVSYGEMGVYIQSFTPSNDVYSATTTFNWHVKYFAYAACTIPNPYGASEAKGWIKLSVNIYDATNGYWMLNGNRELTIWSADNVLGIGNWEVDADSTFTQSISSHFVSGHQYFFYAKINTYTLDAGGGLGWAHTVIDIAPDGGDGRGAWITSVTIY